MAFGSKFCLLALALFVSLALQSAHGQLIPDQTVRGILLDIKERTGSLNTQFAGIRVLDCHKNLLYEKMKTYHETDPVHVERYILNEDGFRQHLPNAAYIFIYTRNSPCVQTKRNRGQSCALLIRELAAHYNNLRIYVGFGEMYGTGDHRYSGVPNLPHREKLVMESLCGKPQNLRYMFMPKTGQHSMWIDCDGYTVLD